MSKQKQTVVTPEHADSLVDAVKKAKASWSKNPHDSVAVYPYTIGSLISKVNVKGATPEMKRLCAESLPHFLHPRVASGELMSMCRSTSVALLLQDKELLHLCLAQPNGDKTVAWFCVHRAFECEQFGKKDRRSLTSNILEMWLGKPLPVPTKPTMADTVGIVYAGHPGLADLLGVDYHRQTASMLWKSNAPIVLHQTSPVEGKSELPNDISA